MPSAVRTSFLLLLGLIFLHPETAAAQSQKQGFIFECSAPHGGVRVETTADGKVNICRIGDQVLVKSALISEWMANSAAKTEAAQNPETTQATGTAQVSEATQASGTGQKKDLSKFVLALDGQLLVGNYGQLIGDGLSFQLTRNHENTANMAAWKSLLKRASLFKPELMKIAIALEDSAERYGEQDIAIQVASPYRLGIVCGVYALLLFIFFWFVRHGGLLRDPGPQPASGAKPYSLGAAQMAFWFFIVLGGFLYVWLVSGDLSVLTPGVLGLIGISAVTGLASVSVGASQQTGNAAQMEKLKKEKLDLTAGISTLETQIAASPAPANLDALELDKSQKAERLASVTAKLSQTTKPDLSVGFLQDILSSGGEVSLPRFQMLGWSLVLGIVFVHSVWTTLTMPEFDATLLSLMGISSGTYVGFKIPNPTGKGAAD